MNHYTRLQDKALQFQEEVFSPKVREMFVLPKVKIDTNTPWYLKDVYERVQAADDLGYDVKLVANDRGLVIQCVKRPTRPELW